MGYVGFGWHIIEIWSKLIWNVWTSVLNWPKSINMHLNICLYVWRISYTFFILYIMTYSHIYVSRRARSDFSHAGARKANYRRLPGRRKVWIYCISILFSLYIPYIFPIYNSVGTRDRTSAGADSDWRENPRFLSRFCHEMTVISSDLDAVRTSAIVFSRRIRF